MQQRLLVDPLLGLIAPRALESPFTAAFAYSILATGTSALAAAVEGRLIDGTHIYWGRTQLFVHPFASNFSTLLDFAILNPLVIFFLFRSRQTVIDEPLLAPADTRADRALHWFAAVSCVVLSIVLMLCYSHSFLYGKFFDAVVAISDQGETFVTVTGWVVLFWTGLFTYIVLMGALNQINYIVRICQLRLSDLVYDPLHEDGAAGLRVFAKPALEFTKASLTLLVIGVVFWVYDRIMIGAPLTDRTASIAIFALIVFPLFAIPIARLHFIMCDLRENLLKSMLEGESRLLRCLRRSLVRRRRGPHSMKQLADEIEATEKLRNTVMSYPTWPMPTTTLVSCGAYFASIATPAVTKLMPVVSAALGFPQ